MVLNLIRKFLNMLHRLSIQNYALIEKIEIDFPGCLTIITGETGAGKSILLGALALIAGSRADSSALQDKTKKCIVEGSFDIKNYSLRSFFTSNELDYSENTVIRREVSPEGKSRAFINDTPVTLFQLRELTLQLIDIHSQHETLTLNESAYQLRVVDAFAGTSEWVAKYVVDHKKYKELDRSLLELTEKEKQSKLDADYWQFQFKEFEETNLQAGEQEEIENELKILNNSEEIKSVLSKCAKYLDGGDMNIISSIAEVKTLLSGISLLNPAYAELFSRINSSCIELKDIAGEIESAEDKTNYDPSRAELLSERIDLIYRLQKKHRVNSVEELMEVKRKVDIRLNDIASMGTEISGLQQEVEKLRQKLFLLAKRISADRKKCLAKLEKEVSLLLASLAMPNAQFRVEHILLETLTEQGIDKMKFLFSANKGSDLKEISKVASGGELSRLMLSIKSLIAKKTALPSIIFDEIDTGVSGGVAEQVGRMINDMSDTMQVFAITHLPQIASKGNSHFTVFKEESKNKTVTNIRQLSKDDRIKEIASMLSAGKPTDASVKNAKELLKA
ncbi:MAG: DNA repair protein RecN [Bacteroidetes bacterium]|nr:MAG: DNA repair protein RecN [Bacteroidota bacterium]